ncbi:orotidine-5'-phosphate decarboxylase [Candidatus Bathyarchaeota archaeon]|nr:orotidine-5'-phosphate decarboxylase [Candidatus Bathyarchaeota archaeon]
MITFLETFLSMRREKRSLLCVGLDPALPGQRGKNLIPDKYLKDKDENVARLEFCLYMVKLTAEYCCAFKPNHQYVLGWTGAHHRTLTSAIRRAGAMSVLDCKLGDIGDTIDSALYHIRKWGYDAITFNPLLGNLKETVEKSHKSEKQLGILVLTLTSNREAIRYQKEAMLEDSPLFLAIARDVRDSDADGCVMGATDHVTEKDLREVRSIVGPDRVFLIPGIGTQKGDLDKLLAAGGNVLVNVSRDIIYSKDPQNRAREYCTRLRDVFPESGFQ